MDEALRTPEVARPRAQQPYFAGKPQPHEIDVEGTVIPDHPRWIEAPGGGTIRAQVELKSDWISKYSESRCAGIARRYTDRAVEKLAHLPQGETFIFSYAEMPEEAIQRAMAREHFRAGNPIREVRFGSATWRKPAHHPGEQAP